MQERILAALVRLAKTNRLMRSPGLDLKMLAGLPGMYRLRVGDFRVIFHADGGQLRVTRIAHRSSVYRT